MKMGEAMQRLPEAGMGNRKIGRSRNRTIPASRILKSEISSWTVGVVCDRAHASIQDTLKLNVLRGHRPRLQRLSNLRFLISNLRCRIRAISRFPEVYSET